MCREESDSLREFYGSFTQVEHEMRKETDSKETRHCTNRATGTKGPSVLTLGQGLEQGQ